MTDSDLGSPTSFRDARETREEEPQTIKLAKAKEILGIDEDNTELYTIDSEGEESVDCSEDNEYYRSLNDFYITFLGDKQI